LMGDRETELRQLTAELREHESVDDAFLAKSFTDRLVILDIVDSDGVPEDIADCLEDHDLRGADAVYGNEGSSFAGNIGESTRHHFVDVQSRGSHQSYVVE